MPELPEVHTITQDLKRYVEGAVIKDVFIEGSYIARPDNEAFLKTVRNTKIVNIFRIAKNILMELSDENFIIIHLAMTGKVLLRPKRQPKDNWQRVIFNLEKNSAGGGAKEFELRFCDMRMFGKVGLVEKSALQTFKKKYGPEPIDTNLTPEEFLKQLQSKKTIIKNVLLDQNIIAGLGNIYVIDALWLAQIHPQANTQKLTLQHATNLLQACREVLHEGIKNRGISMSDYVDLLGRPGQQQDFFKVYQKKNCVRCKSTVKFVKLGGRGTYFCETCQPLL